MVDVAKRDEEGRPVVGADGHPVMVRDKEYSGKRRKLGYLAPAASSNPIHVTSKRGALAARGSQSALPTRPRVSTSTATAAPNTRDAGSRSPPSPQADGAKRQHTYKPRMEH